MCVGWIAVQRLPEEMHTLATQVLTGLEKMKVSHKVFKDCKFDASSLSVLVEIVSTLKSSLKETATAVGEADLETLRKLRAEVEKLLNALPSPDNAQQYLKIMSSKRTGADKITTAQVKLETWLAEFGKDDNSEVKEARSITTKTKTAIANYALIAVISNPHVKADNAAGKQFRNDLRTIVEQHQDLPLHEQHLQTAKDILNAGPSAAASSGPKRKRAA